MKFFILLFFILTSTFADSGKLQGSFCKTDPEQLKLAERYLDPLNLLDDYRLNKTRGLGEPTITFFDITQARNYFSNNHPLFKDYGGSPNFGPDSAWKEWRVTLEKSDFNNQNMGAQQSFQESFARVRVDTEVIETKDPKFKFNKSGKEMPRIEIKQAHFNLEVDIPNRDGKLETVKLKINFNCNGQPCKSKDLAKLFKN